MTITFYELMGLVKDGKAPKEIKVCGGNNIYKFNKDYSSIESLYLTNDEDKWVSYLDITLDTKFEILPEENDEWEDIEELAEYIYTENYSKQSIDFNRKAINQLIKNQKYLKKKLEEK